MAQRYWLMKSEPDVFSFDDLVSAPKRTTCWDGVRNFQARNFLRDEIRVGDGVLFYHSGADGKAVVGTAEVVKAGHPDPTQFDARSGHHDPESPKDAPRWYAVDIRAEERFERAVTLEEMRTVAVLRKMRLLQRGQRLSVLPVTAAEWKIVVKLGSKAIPPSSRSQRAAKEPR
jgi:predicted RNA-binding protein with PUA-like domain